MIKSLIDADTQFIEKNILENWFLNLTADVVMLTNLISTVILNLFKDSLNPNRFARFVMFYQNWKLSLLAIIMIPLSIHCSTLSWKKNDKSFK